MANYFNSLPLRRQLAQLGLCRFMGREEFKDGADTLKGKKLVVVGCGSQGLNQGLCLRDSGLDVSYALREEAIKEQRASWQSARKNDFKIGNYEELIPSADLVLNLTPDKQHASVIERVMPLMKQGATLSYSHGFNIVEQGQQIRDDITVIMVAPKCPGTEVREEYLRGFGVPTLIAVHPENDPKKSGLETAKAYAAAIGSHRAGVLESSFIAEVKSDLVGEQTILCGMLQTGSLLCFNRMVELGVAPGYAARLVQFGWETITEAMKHGGLTNMMDRLPNAAKIRAFHLAEELKTVMHALYQKHMDEVISGAFSEHMMRDWADGDRFLLERRASTAETAFEKTPSQDQEIPEQEFFDNGVLMVAMVKAGVELAFESMTASGILPESAYYESLHEVPLIANLIARSKLHEMNKVISDTAEFGCYLFADACTPLLADFMRKIDSKDIGAASSEHLHGGVDNLELIAVNERIRAHRVEEVGKTLRGHMTAMKQIH